MNDIPMNGNGGNGGSMPAPPTTGGTGFLGGMNIETISALVVLASAFMRR
jgi:hypothetical protein